MYLSRCVYQHKYHAAAAADNLWRDPAILVYCMNSHASLSWGKRTVQCDVVYHYAKLIPNNPSEFNLDISEMQLGYEKCREVIKCVTHICYILNKP